MRQRQATAPVDERAPQERKKLEFSVYTLGVTSMKRTKGTPASCLTLSF
jgi:hypothetical protein